MTLSIALMLVSTHPLGNLLVCLRNGNNSYRTAEFRSPIKRRILLLSWRSSSTKHLPFILVGTALTLQPTSSSVLNRHFHYHRCR